MPCEYIPKHLHRRPAPGSNQGEGSQGSGQEHIALAKNLRDQCAAMLAGGRHERVLLPVGGYLHSR